MKKLCALTLSLLMALGCLTVSALGFSFEITIDYNDNTLNLSGTSDGNHITYYIEAPDMRVDNLGKIPVENGEFIFSYVMQEPQDGIYTLTIRDDTMNEPIVENFEYIKPPDPEDTIELNLEDGNHYNVIIAGKNLRSLSEKIFVIEYDPQKLDVEDLCILTKGDDVVSGAIPGTDIIITAFDHQNGIIKMKLNKDYGDKQWTGVVNVIRFVPNEGNHGETTVICQSVERIIY